MAKRLDSEEIIEVFHCMNVNSVARVMSFLALLYYRREFDENIRESVRLVAGVLKLKTLKKVEKSLLQGLTPYIGLVLVNLLTHDFIKTL